MFFNLLALFSVGFLCFFALETFLRTLPSPPPGTIVICGDGLISYKALQGLIRLLGILKGWGFSWKIFVVLVSVFFVC